MFRKKSLPIICFFLLLSSTVYAQETAELVYAEGEGFTLVREGQGSFYDLYVEDPVGMILQPGDLLLTEQETWLEIEINKTGSLIKIAENTTFSINSLENKGGTFAVSYGRIRAKVNKLTDDSPFWVQGTDTVAGVRGTDFGYDLFFERDKPEKTRTDVYCFEGKVEVVKLASTVEDAGPADVVSSLMLGRNEMVSVESDSDEALEKERVSAELKEFWGLNDFAYEEKVPESTVALKSFYQDSKQLKQAALFSGLTGSLLGGIGTASYLWGDAPESMAWGMGGVGATVIGFAGYLYIRSLIIDSRNVPVPASE